MKVKNSFLIVLAVIIAVISINAYAVEECSNPDTASVTVSGSGEGRTQLEAITNADIDYDRNHQQTAVPFIEDCVFIGGELTIGNWETVTGGQKGAYTFGKRRTFTCDFCRVQQPEGESF